MEIEVVPGVGEVRLTLEPEPFGGYHHGPRLAIGEGLLLVVSMATTLTGRTAPDPFGARFFTGAAQRGDDRGHRLLRSDARSPVSSHSQAGTLCGARRGQPFMIASSCQ